MTPFLPMSRLCWANYRNDYSVLLVAQSWNTEPEVLDWVKDRNDYSVLLVAESWDWEPIYGWVVLARNLRPNLE